MSRRPPKSAAADRAAFFELSETLTGFARIELEGRGVGAELLAWLVAHTPPATTRTLWQTWRWIVREAGDDRKRVDELVREAIFGNVLLAPLARNVVQMWYLGNWTDLAVPANSTVVSAAAYREGLVWQLAGTHPPGAKQPGHGTWARAPAAARR